MHPVATIEARILLNKKGRVFAGGSLSFGKLLALGLNFSQLFLTRFGLSMRFACQTLGAQLRGQLVSGLLLSAILREGFRGVLLLPKETLGALFF